ncbi:hypothetical protein [Flammeovirga sp. SJP92]|uniref:hypothetical protein n=1 Tax=Flammeovirga sp. SJP92 TaxID=1775430 RepID=UPI0007899949|nr:hypothetical protein [Flammeovirga sp. SJP92]KXX68775.1 hypothetical protein AVL50_18225 [Flammeovirga sp. SJP92]
MDRIEFKIKKNGIIKNKTCIIPISLSNPNHYNEKFELIINWASQNYSEIVMNLADSLYRHNYLKEDLDYQRARKIAYEKGNSWIDTHKTTLNRYAINQINRWDKWLEDEDFISNLETIDQEYEKNDLFRSTIDYEVDVYLKRKIRESQSTDFIKTQSIKFLLEEAAVYPIIGKYYKADRIYPSKTPEWMKYVQEKMNFKNTNGMQNLNFIRLFLYR